MVISGEEILGRKIVWPQIRQTQHVESGLSYGAGPASYDFRIKQQVILEPDDFKLASSVEKFIVPNDLIGFVYDKSTLARMGLLVGIGTLEPGWHGHLTLELKNQGHSEIILTAGQPIAKIVFVRVDGRVAGYDGKYQSQADMPVDAKRFLG